MRRDLVPTAAPIKWLAAAEAVPHSVHLFDVLVFTDAPDIRGKRAGVMRGK